MEQPLITGGAVVAGALIAFLGQWVLHWQKSKADAKNRIRADQARFATDVFLYLRLISDINEAEDENRVKGKVEPLNDAQRATLSKRYRAVVSSTNQLMTNADRKLVELSEAFLRDFAEFAYAHRKITTGRNENYLPQGPLRKAGRKIRMYPDVTSVEGADGEADTLPLAT